MKDRPGCCRQPGVSRAAMGASLRGCLLREACLRAAVRPEAESAALARESLLFCFYGRGPSPRPRGRLACLRLLVMEADVAPVTLRAAFTGSGDALGQVGQDSGCTRFEPSLDPDRFRQHRSRSAAIAAPWFSGMNQKKAPWGSGGEARERTRESFQEETLFVTGSSEGQPSRCAHRIESRRFRQSH